MKRATLLNRLVEPSPSGRIHDMECKCVKRVPLPYGEYMRVFDKDCRKCRGTGRVATRLSRREAHAVVTHTHECAKVGRRVEQYIDSKLPMWL